MPQGRRKWIAVMALGLSTGVLVGSASAGALAVPGISVPSTTVPSVTLPGATTPSVTTPSASTPSTPLSSPSPSSSPAPAPIVTAPSVKTPSVKTPVVKAPSTQTPSVSVGGSGSPSSGSGSGSGTSGPVTGLVQTVTGTGSPSSSNPTGKLSPSSALPGSSGGLGGGTGGDPLGGGNAGPRGSAGGAGGTPYGFTPYSPTGSVIGGPSGDFGGAFAPAAGRPNLATTAGLRSALAPLIGCLYGLSQPELTVITLRAGFNGRAPLTRQQTANRLGTSPRQVSLIERRALSRLNGLSQTRGCGGTTEIVGGITVVNSFIGPAEIAISPALVAFGNPGYQGFEQSSFGRLGQVPAFGSPAPLPARFGPGSSNTSTWAFQLLAIMLLVALVGFRRTAPLVIARLRRQPLPESNENLEYLDRVEAQGSQRPPAVDRPVEHPAERREKIAA
jgi:hypothetical protein